MNKEVKLEDRRLIGEHLKKIREKKGISTYRITKDYGLPYRAIRAIENGSSNYTIDNFLTLIRAINCYFCLDNTMDGFITLDENKRNKIELHG